jgi:preprotein translocase subunit SecF
VRVFPSRPEITSQLDEFLLKIGAKEMVASTKKETDGAIATRWNQSVLGLVATLLIVISALVTVVVSYTNLSADFRNYQKATDEKFQRVDAEKLELKQKVEKVEDWQRQDSLQKAKIDGYKAGRTDSDTGTHDEKEKK